MPRFSIKQLAEMTGKTRETIKRKLDGLDYLEEGTAYLFDSKEALEAIYGVANDDYNGNPKSLTEARTLESMAKAEKTQIEIETMRKERIPIEILNAALEKFFGLLKTRIMQGGPSEAWKKEMIESIRDIPKELKW